MIYYGLVLFFLFEYVRPGAFVPGLDALHLNSVIPITVFLGSLIGQRRTTNLDVLREANSRRMLFLLGLLVISVLTADVTLYAYNKLVSTLGYVFVFWAIVREVDKIDRIKGLFTTLIFVHLLLAASTPQMFLDTSGRYYLSSGTFLGDGNDFALSVNIAIPFCLFLLLDARTVQRKMLYAAALLVLVACVVLTKSRGGTVGLVCVGLYYWVSSKEKLRIALLVAVLVGLIFLLAPANYFARMGTIGDTEESSTQGRITAWNAAVRMALDHPVLGVGAGHFGVAYGARYKPPELGHSAWLTAHSIYFLMLGELGFPGLGVLVLFIIANLARNRRLRRTLQSFEPAKGSTHTRLLVCLSASVIAFATNGAFLSAAYYPHLYVLAGLLTASSLVVRGRIETIGSASEGTGPLVEEAGAAIVKGEGCLLSDGAWTPDGGDHRPRHDARRLVVVPPSTRVNLWLLGARTIG